MEKMKLSEAVRRNLELLDDEPGPMFDAHEAYVNILRLSSRNGKTK